MKVRGATTLFNDIFYDEAPVVALKPRKGRCEELNAKRNECLVARYFFTGRETRKNYPDLIRDIADQFFISPSTVHDVIQDNYSMLMALKKESPAKAYFQKKWPNLVW